VPKTPFDQLAGLVPEEAVGGRPKRPVSGRGAKGVRRLGKRGAGVLSGVPIFLGLSKRHLRRVAEISDEVSFRLGESIVQEGMLGETLYVLLQGEAKVSRGGRTIARLYPGDFFGEIGLLDGGPRIASVVAETPVVAVRVFRHAFLDLVQQEPLLSISILAELARRLRNVQRPLTG
jgi:CRP-like cAMP-binding protein